MTAKKPSGEASTQRRRNQPASNSRPFQRSHQLTTTIASMTSPIPTMMRKPKKGMATGGRSSAGKSLRPAHRAVRVMGENEAAQVGDRDGEMVRRRGVVGNDEQVQRHAAFGVPDRLDRGELRRLMFERVEAVRVAEKDLQRNQHAEQPQRHREHHARLFDEAPAPEPPGGDADHDEAGRDVDGVDRMGEAIGEGRAEDDREPVLRHEAAVDHRDSPRASASSCWSRGSRRSRTSVPKRHHQRGEEMRPARHQLAAEQQHAEEGRFEKEGRQPFIGEQRREDVCGRVGKPAPVGAELERHDDARHDAHAERHGENLDPEGRDAEIDLAPGREMQALEDGDERGKPDREGRQQEMPRDDPGELEPRQQKRIESHSRSVSHVGIRGRARRDCQRLSRLPPAPSFASRRRVMII